MDRFSKRSCWGMAPLMVLLGLPGCVIKPEAATAGRLDQLKVGAWVDDFSFVGHDGKVERFSWVRGVVTILVLPASTDWVDSQQCRDLEALAARLSAKHTPVTVVSVAVPKGGSQSGARTFQVCPHEGRPQLVDIHDSQGRMSKAAAAGEAGKFFVIDSAGYIKAAGSLGDTAPLAGEVRKQVQLHEDQCTEMMNPKLE